MEQQPPKRAPTPASWKPGTSGNPRGRPRKGNALTEAVRDDAEPHELVSIALDLARNGENESTRLQALAWLRDSGYTKPAERHEHAMAQAEPDDDGIELLSDEELVELEYLTRARDELLARGRERRERVQDPLVSDGAPRLLPATVALGVAR